MLSHSSVHLIHQLIFHTASKKMTFLKYTNLVDMKRTLLLVMRFAIFCSFKTSQVTTSISVLDTKRAKFDLMRSSPDYLYQKTLKISNLIPSTTASVFYKGHLLKGLKGQQKFNDTIRSYEVTLEGRTNRIGINIINYNTFNCFNFLCLICIHCRLFFLQFWIIYAVSLLCNLFFLLFHVTIYQ